MDSNKQKLFSTLLVVLASLDIVNDFPLPAVVVRSQSLLYNHQPGRQVDLTQALPNQEVFWLNIEEGYFACQVNESKKYIKLFKLSRLCDGNEDCYRATDELPVHLKCTKDCQRPCGQHGVCLQAG